MQIEGCTGREISPIFLIPLLSTVISENQNNEGIRKPPSHATPKGQRPLIEVKKKVEITSQRAYGQIICACYDQYQWYCAITITQKVEIHLAKQ